MWKNGELQTQNLRINITKKHINNPGVWVVSVREFGWSVKDMKISSECSEEQAQEKAIQLCRDFLISSLNELNDISKKNIENIGKLDLCYILQEGSNNHFLVFNPLFKKLIPDIDPVFKNIELSSTDFWNEIRSKAWSSNCRFFFVINEDSIIIGNTLDHNALLCENLSENVFKEYLKVLK